MLSLWILDLRRLLYSLWIALHFGGAPLVQYLFRMRLDVPDVAARMRLAFESLGLTYMKLGQYLAARMDLVPEEMRREFGRLFEQATPVEFERIRQEVESELELPLEGAFAEFSREPIGSASVAQVHEARTLDGEHVAVKIQRPGVARVFAADIRNLRRFAAIIDSLGMLGTVSARELLDEFARWTARELDFITEGRTADRLRRESLPIAKVPRVYWGLTRRRILTLEFIDGMSLARLIELIEAGEEELIEETYPELNLIKVAENLAFIVMHQLFVTGFFHGDPHPGNIFVRGDNTVALLDCGIFGELSDIQREYLAGHIENMALGNIDESFRYYEKQLTATDETDLKAFEVDGKAVLRRWYQKAMNPFARPEDRHVGKYGGEMLAVVRRHHLRLSTDTLLFWRALETLDATALRFGSRYDHMATMQAFFERIRPSLAQRVWQSVGHRGLWRGIGQLVTAAWKYADVIPRGLEGPAPVLEQETPRTRRLRDRHAKWVAVPVFGLTAAALLARVLSGETDATPELVLTVAATAMLICMVVALMRR